MSETQILTGSRYKKLLTDLRKLIQEGRAGAEQAASQILVQTYWEMGKRINEERLTENAGYGDSILIDLAEDLEIDQDTLRRSEDFFLAYKISAPRGGNLTWSHFRELLALPDETRSFYEKEAKKQNWTRDELVSAIRRKAFHAGGPSKKSVKKFLKRPDEATYVYKAAVVKIVDGDTLILRIDLGFLVSKEQRIRLAGIDCPPIDTAKGYEAFEFVRDQLAKAPFVMVKTHQIDIYGRYVTHLFYSFTEKDKVKIFEAGRYLNQELLDKGLARLG